MKKFKDLKIGDYVYLFSHKSRLYASTDDGKPYKAEDCFQKEAVNSLIGENGKIKINILSNSRYSGVSSDCKYLIENPDCHSEVIDAGKSYEKTIFSDLEQATSFAREYVLSAIRYEEELAIKAADRSKTVIEMIRKHYWDILK